MQTLETNCRALQRKQKKFFLTGKTRPLSFRRQQLKNLKKALRTYQLELFEALKTDLGKHETESYLTEIGYVYHSLTLALNHLEKWAKPSRQRTPLYLQAGKSWVQSDPYGTVLVIGPFNYPVQLVIEPLIGAIAAGNTAVVKPSELTPTVSAVLQKMINHTFPEEYLVCVQGDAAVNQALLAQPFDFIFFTGSVRVGKIVMAAAAKHLTPVCLELGGKSPAIVTRSANLKIAARRIIWGKLLNTGQTCVAPDYVIADQTIKKDLLLELEKAILHFYGGDIENNPDYGRIVNDHHFTRLSKILDADQAQIFFGGRTDPATRFIEPTLLDLPDLDAASMKEEIFGPLLPVLTYQATADLIETVRHFPNPLALYLFSSDQALCRQLLERIPSGGVSINDTVDHLANPYLPFGGVGNSGIGAYHGRYSFETFSHQRAVYQKATWLDLPLQFPPYTKAKTKLIKYFLR